MIYLFAGFSGSTQYGTCIFECDFDTYDVTVNNGFGTDFGFIISDIDGNTVVSGGNNFSDLGCLDLENGCYTISLSSSNGGGFGSASLAIGDYEFDSNDGTGGYWSSVITNGLGNGCPTPGCTSVEACNYNENATSDDGSCWYAQDCENYCETENFDNIGDGEGYHQAHILKHGLVRLLKKH